jgi:DNA-binding NarL/FixJ family response regulator
MPGPGPDSVSDGEDDAERPITVFLVDDHSIVRTGLNAYLSTEPGIEVVGEAADGREALARLAVLAAGSGVPDVILMDMQMPHLGGVETTARVKSTWPEIDVIAVTSFLEEARIRAALEAGATGYLLKDADAEDVVDAIRATVAGEVRLDPVAAAALASALRAPKSAVEDLTPREREVIVLVASGRTNREVGRRLGVTERTARTHVSNILTKLGLASRTQAAMWAVREGLVDASDVTS